MIGGLITNRQKPAAPQLMPDEVSDADMQRMLASNAAASHALPTPNTPDEMTDDQMQAEIQRLQSNPPPGKFVGTDGQLHDKTVSRADKNAGAFLGATEIPLMGYNDEILGSANALMDQGAHGIDAAAKYFLGVDPHLRRGEHALTMAEGRAEAADIKNKYAAARETGEIPWDNSSNLASDAGNLAGSILPYEGLYRGFSVPLGLTKLPAWAQTGASLLGAGATATALTEGGNAVGTPGERVDQVVKAGGGPLVVGAMLNILGYGLGKGAAAGGKIAAERLAGPAKAAYRRLAELANDAGVSIEDIAQSFMRNHALKPEATLAEAGPNWFRGWQSEAGDVARSPGTADVAARTLMDRQKGATARVAGDIDSAFGAGGVGFKQSFADLDKAASKAAEPLYKEAHAVTVPSHPELDQYMNSTTGREAFQDALDLADIDNVPMQELVPTDANGVITGYPTKLLDYIQRAMRAKADQAYSAGNGAKGTAFKNWRDRFLEVVDAANPKFKVARANYAGSKANQDALELGRSLVDQDPRYIANQMAALGSDAERNFFKQGYGQKLIEGIRKTPYGGNPGYKMTNSLAREQAAEQVLGPEAWQKLKAQSELEDRMTGTVNEVAANSKTAQRLLHHEDSDAQTLEGLEVLDAVAHGGTIGLVRRVGMPMIADALRHVQKAKRAELARMLFSNDPNLVKQALVNIKAEVPHAQMWKAIGENSGAISSGLVNTQGSQIVNSALQPPQQ